MDTTRCKPGGLSKGIKQQYIELLGQKKSIFYCQVLSDEDSTVYQLEAALLGKPLVYIGLVIRGDYHPIGWWRDEENAVGFDSRYNAATKLIPGKYRISPGLYSTIRNLI